MSSRILKLLCIEIIRVQPVWSCSRACAIRNNNMYSWADWELRPGCLNPPRRSSIVLIISASVFAMHRVASTYVHWRKSPNDVFQWSVCFRKQLHMLEFGGLLFVLKYCKAFYTSQAPACSGCGLLNVLGWSGTSQRSGMVGDYSMFWDGRGLFYVPRWPGAIQRPGMVGDYSTFWDGRGLFYGLRWPGHSTFWCRRGLFYVPRWPRAVLRPKVAGVYYTFHDWRD